MSPRVGLYAAPGVVPTDGPIAAGVRELAGTWIARTAVARRYGYHATLKAPFHLRYGMSLEADLLPAITEFAASRAPVAVPSLDVRAIGGFWALTPGADAPALHAFADDVVAAFDRFRAPPSEAELVKRHPERLSGPQRELLGRWGYPYVFEEFRFHITVTDELSGPEHDAAGAGLRADFAPFLGADLPVSALALFVEPEPGADFFIHSVHPLEAS